MLRQVRESEFSELVSAPGVPRPRRKILHFIIETICWAVWGLLALFGLTWLGVPDSYVAPAVLILTGVVALPIAWHFYYRSEFRQSLAEWKAIRAAQSKAKDQN